jgi:uncharacterized membrane protein
MQVINRKINNLKRSNLKGLWCYALGWISGVFFLLTAWDNKFVRFHALQSTILFGLMTIVGIISLNMGPSGWILDLFLVMMFIVLWKWLMWEAHSGQIVKLPLIGNIAARLADVGSAEKATSQMAVRFQK